MSGLNNEDLLAAQLEGDAGRSEAWDEDPEPAPALGRTGLGTQVSIRLNPAQADTLRQIARAQRVGYTSLLRAWIEDRLRWETHRHLPGVTVNRFESAITLAQPATTFDVGDPVRPSSPLAQVR